MTEQTNAPSYVVANTPSELDKAAESFITEIQSEFKSTNLEDEIQDVSDSGNSDATGNQVEQVPGSPEQVAAKEQAPLPEVKPEVAPDLGTERLVAREVALLEREKALKAQEEQYRTYETKLKELESRVVPEDWREQMDLEPHAVLEKMGIDPEQMVRKVIAHRLQAQGKEVPKELLVEIRQAEERIKTRRENRSLQERLDRMEREASARAFFDKVQTEAREYVTKGISEKYPTAADVAKRNPDWVHERIMEVISNDAQSKAARGQNLPLLSYEDATKVVEDYLSSLRNVLVPKQEQTPGEASMQAPKTPVPGANNGQPPPKPQPKPSAPVIQAPERPLAPWLQKPQDDDAALREALLEYQRVEKGISK